MEREKKGIEMKGVFLYVNKSFRGRPVSSLDQLENRKIRMRDYLEGKTSRYNLPLVRGIKTSSEHLANGLSYCRYEGREEEERTYPSCFERIVVRLLCDKIFLE